MSFINLNKPIVILANGTYPTHKTPLGFLNKANSIVCLDGALNNLIDANLEPSLIIGDLDSIKPEFKKTYKNIIIEEKNQNQNDFRKCLSWLYKNNYKEIDIVGATGKREDHSIANIFTILETPLNLEIRIITDYGTFQIINTHKKISSFNGQQVSLFTLDSKTKITTKNLKYELKSQSFKNRYSGTLNESMSNEFHIKSLNGKTLLYATHK